MKPCLNLTRRPTGKFLASQFIYMKKEMQKEPFEQENKIKAEQDQARASKEEEQAFMEALKMR
jgi:hypothetical protein